MRRVALLASLVVGAAAASACTSSEPTREAARVPGTPPAAGGYFALLPAGAALPDERRCAALVRRSSWEPRPANHRANHRVPPRGLRLGRSPSFDHQWNRRYRPRVTGAFVGTTDEIIQWAACKWGLSDELLRAQAVAESYWKQSQKGDFEARSEGHCTPHDRGDPCPTSFGLLQNKWYYNRAAYPWLRTMTPLQVDWSAAQLRGCYDGRKWTFPAGDFWSCIGNWWSGQWMDAGALAYQGRVRTALEAKEWLTWRDRGGTVSYRTGLRPSA